MAEGDIIYLNDSRVIALENGSAWTGYDRRTNTITVEFEDPRTSELLTATFPVKMEVCELCKGFGSVVNPSVDAGGLSEDKACDPEFMEQYKSGVFDITCPSCEGYRVVPDVDRENSDPDLAWRYGKARELWFREQAIIRAEEAAERSIGA